MNDFVPYNLGRYRWKRSKIYEQVWWFIYKCIDKGPYTYMQGVRKVNGLCDKERRERIWRN